MPESPLQLAVLIGSTREGRFGHVVGQWFATQAALRGDMTLDLIDLADLDLPAAYPARRDAVVQTYTERIDRADAFVIVTPEYNHGYPASLKQAIDLPGAEWRNKPVGFVAYGGMGGGLRAVEQLRQVFPELHAMTVRDTVSFHGAWNHFDESGAPRSPEGCNAAAAGMLDQISWWGRALRTARAADDATTVTTAAA